MSASVGQRQEIGGGRGKLASGGGIIWHAASQNQRKTTNASQSVIRSTTVHYYARWVTTKCLALVTTLGHLAHMFAKDRS